MRSHPPALAKKLIKRTEINKALSQNKLINASFSQPLPQISRQAHMRKNYTF
jgi:hypothetical protein